MNKEELIKNIESGKNYNFIGFFGLKDEFRVFSNFYSCEFEAPVYEEKKQVGKKIFCCSEQYFMYLKSIYFEDEQVANKILENGLYPNNYKKLGRQVKNYDDKKWELKREKAMYLSVYYKFYVSNLRNKLVSTADSILVECSPYDAIWGIKLGKDNEWKDPLNWKGENKLGFILMNVREKYTPPKIQLNNFNT